MINFMFMWYFLGLLKMIVCLFVDRFMILFDEVIILNGMKFVGLFGFKSEVQSYLVFSINMVIYQ